MMDFIYAAVSGYILGVLANYLADVLPRNRKLTKPVCLACGEIRQLTDFLRGLSCSHCGKVNKYRFWTVILFVIIFSLVVWYLPVANLPFLLSLAILCLFAVIVITDIEYRVVLEQVSIVGYLICAIGGWYLHGFTKTILGGISGFIVFLGLYYLGKVFARRMSKKNGDSIEEEALGFGDVHLAGIVGLLTGFPYVFTALLFAIILGGIISAGLILLAVLKKDYQAFQAIPYGPFIIFGGIIGLYLAV